MHGLSRRPWVVTEGVEEGLADLTQSAWQEKGDQAPGLLPGSANLLVQLQRLDRIRSKRVPESHRL